MSTRKKEEKGIKLAYFDWLYGQMFHIRDPDFPGSYTVICRVMHSITFNDRIGNDSNRTSEGEELRNEFISTHSGIDIEDFTEIYSMGKASILEVLVALARRAGVMLGTDSNDWFTIFLVNLNLIQFTDLAVLDTDIPQIEHVLTIFNDRTYSPNGEGGIFPLEKPGEDQRKIELWHQMTAYMNENQMY